jgi:ferrous iron transport protein A
MKSDFNTNAPASQAMNLTALDPGGEARIVAVHETGPIGRRLLDLGLLPRTPIKMVRRAPLGDPVLYELRGYRLCLRSVDAACVEIEPMPDEAARG